MPSISSSNFKVLGNVLKIVGVFFQDLNHKCVFMVLITKSWYNRSQIIEMKELTPAENFFLFTVDVSGFNSALNISFKEIMMGCSFLLAPVNFENQIERLQVLSFSSHLPNSLTVLVNVNRGPSSVLEKKDVRIIVVSGGLIRVTISLGRA